MGCAASSAVAPETKPSPSSVAPERTDASLVTLRNLIAKWEMDAQVCLPKRPTCKCMLEVDGALVGREPHVVVVQEEDCDSE